MCDVKFSPKSWKIATSLYKIIGGDSQTHIIKLFGVWDADYFRHAITKKFPGGCLGPLERSGFVIGHPSFNNPRSAPENVPRKVYMQ